MTTMYAKLKKMKSEVNKTLDISPLESFQFLTDHREDILNLIHQREVLTTENIRLKFKLNQLAKL